MNKYYNKNRSTKTICSYCASPKYGNSWIERLKEGFYKLLGYNVSHGGCESCMKKYFD